LRRGLFWSTVAFGGGRGVTFLTSLVLFRLLPLKAIGAVAAVLVYLSLLDLLSDLGMGATVIYEQEEGITDRVQSALTLNVLIAVSLCGLGVLLAPVAAHFLKLPQDTALFRLASLNLLLSGFGNIHDSLLLREMDLRRRTIPQLVRALVRGAVSIALALSGVLAASMVIGFLAGTLAWVIALWIMVPLRFHPVFNRSILRSMVAYDGAASLLEVIAVVVSNIDRVVVQRILGAKALGLYYAGSRVPELALDSVSWNVSLVAFPALSRHRKENDADIRRPTLALVRYGALYALPVGAAAAVLALPLITVLYGSKYSAAAGVLAAASVMYGGHALIYSLGDVFKALGRQRTMVALAVGWIPLLIAVLILVAPHGIVTLAWANTAIAYAQGLLLGAFAGRAAGIHWMDMVRTTRPAFTAAVGAALGGELVRLLLPSPTIVPLMLGGVAALAGALLALRLFDPRGTREIISVARGGPLPQ
jgi:PST family polysaccharide transporter